MKKIICITTAVLLLICMSATSSTAGAARRHTIEGVVIGTSLALIGAAIYNDIHRDGAPDQRQHYPAVHEPPRHDDRYASREQYHNAHRYHRPRAHWEIQRVWIPPVYETRWNPGHYNRRGEWISGGYQDFLVKEGYYMEEKVRIRH